MTRIHFRLVRAGEPQRPVRVFPIWQSANGELHLQEGRFYSVLPGDSLEALTVDDLPEWLRKQGLPLELLPVQEAGGDTRGHAVLGVYRAAEVVERGVPAAETVETAA